MFRQRDSSLLLPSVFLTCDNGFHLSEDGSVPRSARQCAKVRRVKGGDNHRAIQALRLGLPAAQVRAVWSGRETRESSPTPACRPVIVRRGANTKSKKIASANRHRRPAADATSANQLKLSRPTTMTPWPTFPMRDFSEVTARAANAIRGASGTCRITATRRTQEKPAADATSVSAHTIRVLRRRVRRPFGSARPACAARIRRLAAL